MKTIKTSKYKEAELNKYKVWMMQEGRTEEEIIDIFCIGCGKKLPESATMYYDLDENYVFCSIRCSKNINWELEEQQRNRFAMEALKDQGYVRKVQTPPEQEIEKE